MSKIFMGVCLRSLRQERGLTQAALAKALDLSSSYLNQIEQDQRPLTVPVLLKINKVLGVDIQLFSEDEEARVLTQLKDALSVLPLNWPQFPWPSCVPLRASCRMWQRPCWLCTSAMWQAPNR